MFGKFNHLSNTLVTISDNKIGVEDPNATSDNLADYYEARVLSATDYYAFGMAMKERSWQSKSYRYGFNGKEKDKDIGEEVEDFDARLLNKKIGRWFSVDKDAHLYASQSPYNFSLNNPIIFVDPDGNSPKPSEFIAKQLGVKLSPMTAGLIDGAFNGIGILAMGKLAYDLGTDEGFRTEFFESIKAIASDPVGFMKSVVDDHIENIKNIASWNEKGQYAAGEFIGEKVAGVISGGAVAWLMKYTKKFVKPKVDVKKPDKVGEPPSKNKNVDCACFLAGTLVKTKEGDKPIEQVEEGDYLLAQDEATGKLSYKKVLKKHIIFEKEKIYHLYIGKEVIKVTGKHPFRIGSKWVEVQYLHVGDSVTLTTGNRLAIDSIAVINGAYTVYNFTVEDYHTYYVSKTGVLVHNCPDFDDFFNLLKKTKTDNVYEKGKKVERKAYELENLGHNGQKKHKQAVNALRSGGDFVVASEEEALKLLKDSNITNYKFEKPAVDVNNIGSNTNGHFGPHYNYEYEGKKGTIIINK